jgi:hypothetical protein
VLFADETEGAAAAALSVVLFLPFYPKWLAKRRKNAKKLSKTCTNKIFFVILPPNCVYL